MSDIKKKINFEVLNQYDYTKIVYLLLFAFLFICVFFTKDDTDFYHHLNTGKFIVENGYIPEYDWILTTPDLKIYIFSWLTGVVEYCIFSIFGYLGIRIFIIVNWFVILCLLYYVCDKLTNMRWFAIMISAYIGLFLIYVFGTSRPYMFDCLFLCIVLCLCVCSVKSQKYEKLCFLPLISVLQVNFHAVFWIVLFGVLLVFLIWDCIFYKRLNSVFGASFFMFCLCVMLFPYDISIIFHGLFASGDIYDCVSELKQLSVPYILCLVLLPLSCFLLFKNKWKILSENVCAVPICILSLICLVGALTKFRLLLFWLILLALLLCVFCQSNKKYEKLKVIKFKSKVLFGSICSVLVLFMLVSVVKTEETFPIYKSKYPFIENVDKWLEDNIADKSEFEFTFVDNFAYNQYFYWKWGMRPMIDGRFEVSNPQYNGGFDINGDWYRLVKGYITLNAFQSLYPKVWLFVNTENMSYVNPYIDECDKYQLYDTIGSVKVYKPVG